MLDDILPWLACPHCGGHLRRSGASLVCSRGHTSNVARQGYVSLLGRDAGTHTADSAVMVAARERLYTGGAFDPLMAAVSGAAVERAESLAGTEGPVLDLGAGPGHHLAAILEGLPERFGIALDNSKYAARRAAKIHPRIGAVVADTWDRIPVRDRSVALLVNLFAPRNGAEMERVLAPGGGLIVVTPAPDHLQELAEPFGMISVDPAKEERLDQTLRGLEGDREVRTFRWEMSLTPTEVGDLVAMGPSGGRLDPDRHRAAVEALPERSWVSGSVRILTG